MPHDIPEQVFRERFTAEVNELYYRLLAAKHVRSELRWRAGSAILAAVAAVAVLQHWHPAIGAVAALLSSSASILAQFLRPSDQARAAGAVAVKWSAFAYDVRALDESGSDEAAAALPKLRRRAGDLQGEDVAEPDDKLIARAVAAVERRFSDRRVVEMEK